MTENARKKSDFVNICGQFFKANIIAMNVDNIDAVSQSSYMLL